MRRLILLSALLLTACPLPYCPVRPIPPNAPKLHTKAPSSTAFAREKQSESKLPDGDTMNRTARTFAIFGEFFCPLFIKN